MLRLVLVACVLALVNARQDNLIAEGSADWEDGLKGDLDDIDVEESEGSGEEEEVVQMIPDKVEETIEALDKDFHFTEKYDYYHDVTDKTNYDYEDYDDDDYDDDDYDDDEYEDGYDEEYPRGNKGGIDHESVLILDKTTEHSNIEIVDRRNEDPKKPLDKNTSLFETSHILIMAGSALVSFGLVMFAFFMCRRAMDNKKQKASAFVLPPPRATKATTSPIVKNYQRVPTTTKEFLQCRENTHIDMYRGDGVCEQKPTAPPAVYDPLLTKY